MQLILIKDYILVKFYYESYNSIPLKKKTYLQKKAEIIS